MVSQIYGWEPEPFDNETINEDSDHARKAKQALGKLVNPNYIGISCEGEVSAAADDDDHSSLS